MASTRQLLIITQPDQGLSVCVCVRVCVWEGGLHISGKVGLIWASYGAQANAVA